MRGARTDPVWAFFVALFSRESLLAREELTGAGASSSAPENSSCSHIATASTAPCFVNHDGKTRNLMTVTELFDMSAL